MLIDLTERIVGDRAAAADFRPGATDGRGFGLMMEAGIPLALASEESGGFALSPSEVLPLLRAVGGYTGILPIAETLHANWLLSLVGLELVGAAIAPTPEQISVTREAAGFRAGGRLGRVPWSRNVDRVLAFATIDAAPCLVSIATTDIVTAATGSSLSGEPRDDLVVDVVLGEADVVPLPAGFDGWTWRAVGAAIRCQLIAGAAARLLQQTVQYVGERRQFGQPLAKFQAIQQQLAIVAGEVSAAVAAADSAAQGFGAQADVVAIAAAKVRCGEAAGIIAPIVHQVHGAIGFTEEHMLHRLTKQLWTWRDEYGSETLWADWLGRWVLSASQDGLWPVLVSMDAEVARG
ncbi:acyl-CoA dehydrogenase family protein [Sphingomonas naphthae]|uniref:Acyl-CoA dehydrogenase family protein n=1 Tax=Sphingomonas naphthae TaxID=1813468 RepID=A0ABY7TG30_9SPHN|nr:acyl-CoA dehydrogenase family protein [Sphingomonas naphthae]WCT72187.1 acyl-CoA dehydrogenase family protein [Sphingomonas naphthae]